MAFCSAVTLCFASIFSLAAAALLAIGFATDNWQTITVQPELNVATKGNLQDILAATGEVGICNRKFNLKMLMTYQSVNSCHYSDDNTFVI